MTGSARVKVIGLPGEFDLKFFICTRRLVTYSYRLVSFSSVLTACAYIFVVSSQLPASFPFSRVVPVGVCYRL